MTYYNESLDRELFLQDSIKELEVVNKKLSVLLVKKEELTNNIIAGFGHEHEGQKSYEYKTWKIEIKTPCIYSLDKKKFESGDFNLPMEFNPVKVSKSYTIDKRRCDEIMETAPIDIIDSLLEVIEKKPGKSSVIIKERAA